MRRLLLMGTCTAAAMIAAAAIYSRDMSSQPGPEMNQFARTKLTPVTLERRLKMDAFVSGLLSTVAFDMRRARLAHRTTVLAL